MIDTRALLRAFDAHGSDGALAATGVDDLDQLTDGALPGRVWIVVGEVGEGRTTLLIQLALAVAGHGHRVHLVCPREPAVWVAARMLSHLERIPLPHLVGDDRAAVERNLLQRARDRLDGLPVTAFPREGRRYVPETDPMASPRPPAILLDDADLISGVTPTRVAQLADAGQFVVASLPRDVMLLGDGDRAPLHPEWARIADVVMEVRTRTLGQAPSLDGSSRPRPPELRPGEADLVIHRYRWGPTRTLHVGFQGHYARFHSMTL